MLSQLRVPVLLTCLLLAPTALADGQPSPPATTSPRLEDTLTPQAREAYEAAKLLVTNGDFSGAMTKFEQAYDLSKAPGLLYNMAICSKNLHEYARMKTLLEQYERDAGATMPADERAAVDRALEAIKDLVGTLKLTVTPDEASVAIDGATVGTTPLPRPILVDLGKHTLTVKREGFDAAEQSFEVAGGTSSDLAVTLTPVAVVRTADLIVAADQAATVAIDDKVVGSGGYHDRVLAGSHKVRVTEQGKDPFTVDLTLKAGETRTVEVILKDSRHALWPWIAGGAVLVAGAVVGGYFLFKPSNTTLGVPHTGDAYVQLSSFGR